MQSRGLRAIIVPTFFFTLKTSSIDYLFCIGGQPGSSRFYSIPIPANTISVRLQAMGIVVWIDRRHLLLCLSVRLGCRALEATTPSDILGRIKKFIQ